MAVYRRVMQSLKRAQRLASPMAVSPAILHLRHHSILARPRFSPSGRLPQVMLLPRVRQQHSTAEEYTEALKQLQSRLDAYKKIWRILSISAFGAFICLFFGINAVPEANKVLEKKKVRLSAELTALEKQMEGVKEEVSGHQEFLRKNPLEEEESAEN